MSAAQLINYSDYSFHLCLFSKNYVIFEWGLINIASDIKHIRPAELPHMRYRASQHVSHAASWSCIQMFSGGGLCFCEINNDGRLKYSVHNNSGKSPPHSVHLWPLMVRRIVSFSAESLWLIGYDGCWESSAGTKLSVAIFSLYFRKSLLFVKYFTHWAGQFASNSLWNLWQASALSLLSSRHFHSKSLAPQHAFRSAEFGADMTA